MLYRPELEKDNPVAPQMYVGPRRRLAQARKASLAGAPAQDTTETLRTLTETAARFVDGLPGSDRKSTRLNSSHT